MHEKAEMIEALKREKIIAIMRGLPVETAVRVADALYAGGIRFIEVTFRQDSETCLEDTTHAICAIAQRYEDLYVGAGTVITMQQLLAAYDAGAEYIISPNTNVEIIKKCVSLGMTAMPGAMTPSEVVMAHDAGARFVKVFPTDNLGAGYIKAIRAPLSHVEMLAVGGVNNENMAEFYRAGVCGFGIGGNIVNKKMIEAGDFAGLTELAEKYVSVAKSL